MSTGAFKLLPLSAEEEDELIHTRLANDEKLLKRVTKKYYAFASLQRALAANPQLASAPSSSVDPDRREPLTKAEQLVEARDAFLLDLSLFQLGIKKNVLVCKAEERQVLEYEKERQRIENEGVALREDIEHLKVQLDYEQRRRKQKMEYETKADKINKMPSRAESEQSIANINEEIAIARAERDALHAEMLERRGEFDAIVNSIALLRARGLMKEDDMETGAMAVSSGSRPGSPLADGPASAIEEGAIDEGPAGADKEVVSTLNPHAKPFKLSVATPSTSRPGTPRLTSGLIPPSALHLHTGSSRGSSTPLPAPQLPLPPTGDDDIEMGEVAEDAPTKTHSSPKKRPSKEELEEGEDSGSDLTELPDSYQ